MISILLVWQNDAMNISLKLASHEQEKADQNVLRLVEEHKVHNSNCITKGRKNFPHLCLEFEILSFY